MNILGINAFNHDPAACLLSNGKVTAAIEEEKISRQKGIVNFPHQSIKECLDLSGLKEKDIDVVAIPRMQKYETKMHIWHMLRYFPKSLNLLKKDTAALDVQTKKHRHSGEIERIIRSTFRSDTQILPMFHHESHAHSVFFQSDYDEALIFIADGIGEYDTTWIGSASKVGGIKKLHSITFPHSFGMMYAAFTDLLGFRSFNDEWKVMGMAAYGKPCFYEDLQPHVKISQDLNLELDQNFFHFAFHGKNQWLNPNHRISKYRRLSNEPLKQEHYDIACSFQAVFEDKLLQLINYCKIKYPQFDKVCLSGGAFLNSLFNGKLAEAKIFDEVYVDCNPGDAGTTMGAVISAHKFKNNSIPVSLNHSNRLGREYSADQILKILEQQGLNFTDLNGNIEKVSQIISTGNVLGLFNGKAEFGPRALGSRSIVANPADAKVKDVINSQVKYRESFRPFAPSLNSNGQKQFFPNQTFSPYMSFCLSANTSAKEKIPATVHADGTSRIQTVQKEVDHIYHSIIDHLGLLTGSSAVLNTSFNIRGEPIVNSPLDAIQTSKRAKIKYLYLHPYLVEF